MNSGASKNLSRLTAALMLSVSFAAIDRAEAACNPQTGGANPVVNNTTVTCSNTTTNQNDPNGWGTGVETGNTINVQTGATLSGTATGINVIDGTVNNGTAATPGGKISATAAGGIGIQAVGIGTITVGNFGDGVTTGLITADGGAIIGQTVVVSGNTGTIEATGTGGIAILSGADLTVNNSGVIRATSANAGGAAVDAGNMGTITNSGTISTAGSASFAIGSDIGNLNVTNLSGGSIQTNADGSAAIVAGRSAPGVSANVTNAGVIEAMGEGGIAISVFGTATVSSNTGNGITTGIIRADGLDGVAILGATANVDNSALIQANDPTGVAIKAAGAAVVSNRAGGNITAGGTAISAASLDVTNAQGATISGGTIGITGSGSVTNAGTISGGTFSVLFTGAGTNTLILQTGSVLNGAAAGSGTSTDNRLVLQGHGTASNNFTGFNSLDVHADGIWVWDIASPTIMDTTTIGSGGVFVLDSALQTALTVNGGGLLAGHGSVTGNITVAAGGTVAPGAVASFATLSSDVVVFQPGSTYRVSVIGMEEHNQNDKLTVGTATLNGGTVRVVSPRNSTYAPSTRYTILTAAGGGLGEANNNTFSDVSISLAFLTPLLSYDANDVFLTLTCNNTTACADVGVTGGGGGAAPASALLRSRRRAIRMPLQARLTGVRPPIHSSRCTFSVSQPMARGRPLTRCPVKSSAACTIRKRRRCISRARPCSAACGRRHIMARPVSLAR